MDRQTDGRMGDSIQRAKHMLSDAKTTIQYSLKLHLKVVNTFIATAVIILG